ncbi:MULTISPECIES: hypothetical protein [Bacillus]|uniref:hypothetical protein n=1 Tax=Bacillus TaxID=1386 RepID=UPI0005C80549|nr:MULTISPECIES: hypothetical protein [Bacillus]KIZ30578.1 hypothetical protein SK30_09635 [Bacillus cereus]MBJ8126554.1 hypothetical protein [Bacillus cereus]PGB50234.1 hypothetical protein COL95_24065 [Bacillus anthracis]
MSMNHSDFFDFLQSKEVLPNNQELRQSFESIINGFIANEMPDLENIPLEHIDEFEKQFEQLRHYVTFYSDNAFRINGPDCELKEMLHLHLFTEQLEDVEKQGLEDEIFI